MYEKMTFVSILNSVLDRIDDSFDKREGSIIYDAVSPICIELAKTYVDLENTLKQGFASTASREYLIKRAMERGIMPFEATKCIILTNLVGNINLQGNERFISEDGIIFIYISKQDNLYKMESLEKGILNNISYGELLPIDNIQNLESATVHSILTFARNEEETKEFRERYLNSFKNNAFGGNRADYMQKVILLNININILQNGGVGGVKVYRANQAGGKVEIVVINASFKKPTKYLIDIIQDEIDPTKDGKGLGTAPIGHIVTIKPITEVPINITAEIELENEYTALNVKTQIETQIESYLLTQAENWQEQNQITVRVSYIESTILAITGIKDIINTKINGDTRNLTLDEYSIPIRGDIDVN